MSGRERWGSVGKLPLVRNKPRFPDLWYSHHGLGPTISCALGVAAAGLFSFWMHVNRLALAYWVR